MSLCCWIEFYPQLYPQWVGWSLLMIRGDCNFRWLTGSNLPLLSAALVSPIHHTLVIKPVHWSHPLIQQPWWNMPLKHTLLVPRYNHRQRWTTLQRRAGGGDRTAGRPVAPYAVECKFLGANKQPVVRGGWSSWRACVLICVWKGWKKMVAVVVMVGAAACEVKRPLRLI